MTVTFQSITLNRLGKAHYVVKNGRGYYVAPMTLIVPGVLNGSQGALYYPPDEIARDHHAWNGIPLVSYHPTSMTGGHLSAQDDGVLDKQGIGDFFGSHINDKGMLRGQGWFDVEKCNKVNRQIINAVKAGKQIELSTGLFTDNHPAPQGSHFQGKPYTHIARNYRPDHVAILVDQVGACSLHDGCGVHVSNRLVANDEDDDDDRDIERPYRGTNPARMSGYQARERGLDRSHNPYAPGSAEHHNWHKGWDDHYYREELRSLREPREEEEEPTGNVGAFDPPFEEGEGDWTSRGGEGRDWVGPDDYDPWTPHIVPPGARRATATGGLHWRNKPRLAGYEARGKGMDRMQNPHPKGSQARKDWHEGWDDHHFVHEPETFITGNALEGPSEGEPEKLRPDRWVDRAHHAYAMTEAAAKATPGMGSMSPGIKRGHDLAKETEGRLMTTGEIEEAIASHGETMQMHNAVAKMLTDMKRPDMAEHHRLAAGAHGSAFVAAQHMLESARSSPTKPIFSTNALEGVSEGEPEVLRPNQWADLALKAHYLTTKAAEHTPGIGSINEATKRTNELARETEGRLMDEDEINEAIHGHGEAIKTHLGISRIMRPFHPHIADMHKDAANAHQHAWIAAQGMLERAKADPNKSPFSRNVANCGNGTCTCGGNCKRSDPDCPT
jgi:hypothetical protein